MPKYTNNSSELKILGSNRLMPGETIESQVFYKNLPSGVDQVSVLPVFDPFHHSEKVTTSKTVTLNAAIVGNYKLSIYCVVGEVSIKINSSTNQEIILGVGMKLELECMDRVIESIIFTISSGTAILHIQKI